MMAVSGCQLLDLGTNVVVVVVVVVVFVVIRISKY